MIFCLIEYNNIRLTFLGGVLDAIKIQIRDNFLEGRGVNSIFYKLFLPFKTLFLMIVEVKILV